MKIEILPPKALMVADSYTSKDVYFIRKGVCLEMNRKGKFLTTLRALFISTVELWSKGFNGKA